MTRTAIVASGAICALGVGARALAPGPLGASARVAIARDDELERAGLRRPSCARVPAQLLSAVEGRADRAGQLLYAALRDLCGSLDRALPDWRALRVGCVIGT